MSASVNTAFDFVWGIPLDLNACVKDILEVFDISGQEKRCRTDTRRTVSSGCDGSLIVDVCVWYSFSDLVTMWM